MRKYKYYDTDIKGEAEYDIVDTDYFDMINTCFKYCVSFAVIVFENDNEVISKLSSIEQYRIPLNPRVSEIYSYFDNSDPNCIKREVRHYALTPEVRGWILKLTNSIFSWLVSEANPEEPSFYREDGSAFLYGLLHEGELILETKDDENVDNIISKEHWITRPQDDWKYPPLDS